MKLHSYNPDTSLDRVRTQNKKTRHTDFDMSDIMMHSSWSRESSLVDRFRDLTDSMPKENQISLAASLIVGHFSNEEFASEKDAFIENIVLRFDASDINSLKNQITNHPSYGKVNQNEIGKLLHQLEQMSVNMNLNETDPALNHQALPAFRTPEELFFRSTFNHISDSFGAGIIL